MLVTLAVALAAAACDRKRDASAPADVLRMQLDRMEEPASVDFTFTATGTSVTRCFRPNRTFTGAIDQERGVVVLRSGSASAEPMAVVDPSQVLVRASLLGGLEPRADWYRLPKDLGEEARVSLRAALGSELAGYVLDGKVPSTARETLLAALDAAQRVRRVAGTGPDVQWEIDLDAEQFRSITDEETDATGDDGEVPVPRIVATIEGSMITRVEVQLDRSKTPGEEGELGGWTVEYRPARAKVEPPAAMSIEDIEDDALRAVGPARIESCEVPL